MGPVMGLAVAGSASGNEEIGKRRPPDEAVLPVLLYHDVADGPAHERFRRYVVPPGLLDEHLSALASAGYRTAHASAVLQPSAAAGDSRPVVYLTFDDGYRSFATAVMPALVRYGMTGTVFVPTAHVGGPAAWLSDLGEQHRTLMTWDEIRDVAAAGAEVGAHGHRHLPFDIVSRRQLGSELSEGRCMLEDCLGAPVGSLAYPFGFHDRSVRRSTRACGYRVAFEVGDNLQRGPGPSPTSDGILRIRRIIVDPATSADDLLGLVRHGRRSPAMQRARCIARPGFRLVRRVSAVRRGP
jgi:peptidoglycan/xylan/chitin deacetylase (PgdA/CDA1 family)